MPWTSPLTEEAFSSKRMSLFSSKRSSAGTRRNRSARRLPMICHAISARRKAALGSLLPLCLFCCALPGRESAPNPASAAPPPPRVSRISGTLAPDETINVTVDNLEAWAAKNDSKKLVPYIDGRPLRGNHPVAIDGRDNTLKFDMQNTSVNRAVWSELLGAPLDKANWERSAWRWESGWGKQVKFSVGLEDETPFASDLAGASSPYLVIILPKYGVISLLVIATMTSVFFWLVLRTNLIRDAGPESASGVRKPYNLGKAQIAFWFFLTYVSYIVIWLITDDIETITPGLVALMGISAMTALGAVLIDSSKDAKGAAALQSMTAERTSVEQAISALQGQLAALAPGAGAAADDAFARNNLNNELLQKRTRLGELVQALGRAGPAALPASEGFVRDIMSDGEGYSFNRFQMIMWTLALGVVFVSKVYNNLTMPEFSATLLGLMGVSSGTYIALKFPEKR